MDGMKSILKRKRDREGGSLDDNVDDNPIRSILKKPKSSRPSREAMQEFQDSQKSQAKGIMKSSISKVDKQTAKTNETVNPHSEGLKIQIQQDTEEREVKMKELVSKLYEESEITPSEVLNEQSSVEKDVVSKNTPEKSPVKDKSKLDTEKSSSKDKSRREEDKSPKKKDSKSKSRSSDKGSSSRSKESSKRSSSKREEERNKKHGVKKEIKPIVDYDDDFFDEIGVY